MEKSRFLIPAFKQHLYYDGAIVDRQLIKLHENKQQWTLVNKEPIIHMEPVIHINYNKLSNTSPTTPVETKGF